ncbi:MAG: hypothetical protein ABSB91_03315 [Sedimentisphaerales bacterium]
MDKYHKTFDVHTDLSAAGNHFVTYGALGDANNVAIKPGCRISPYSGDTCIENKFIANGSNWGGWYFMNGVLEGTDAQPKLNFGTYPNAGVDLSGATQLDFEIRGAEGGERVEIFAFGVGRDDITGTPVAMYPDSSEKVSLGYITLSTEWTHYSIYLAGHDLSYVLGGFGWVTNAPNNNYHNVTFYLDDIKYNKSRFNEPRFLVSYETIPSSNDFDMVLKNVAFTYDNALVLIALLARGTPEDMNRAQLLADAFVYAVNNDRYFTDSRLRDTYQGGDLVLPPGWVPNGRKNTVRMTGWWDPNSNQWLEDKGFVSSSTGNIAWSIIALLSYYQKAGGDQYLSTAVNLGEWIKNNTTDSNGAGGYTGGYQGWEPTANHPEGQNKLTWKSTEHNIDVYAAFMRLYEITGDPNWSINALRAKTFVEAMWDAGEGHFWTGTLDDGITINKSNIPLDIQAWALIAIGGHSSAVNWAQNNCYTEKDGYKGYDFNNDKDGIWFEGTAQMAVGFQINAEPNESASCISELRKAQAQDVNGNGKGIVAASHDGVTTGFDWAYFDRLHIGATSWYIFAEMNYNPYWGTKTIPAEPINYILTVNSSGASGVNISSNTGHGGTTAYTKSVASGTSVNLQAPAYAVSGSSTMRFTSWIGSVNSSSQSITISMDANETVTANYASDTHLLLYDSLNSSESITGNGGTASGVTFTDGLIDNAANINGYIDYPYTGHFEPSAGTIQFLVKPDDTGSMGLFEAGQLGYANSIGIFRIYNYGRTITILEVRKNDSSYLQAWHDVDTVRLENGQWCLVTAVWQCNTGTNDFFQLYLNDVPGYRHSGSVCTDFALPGTQHIRLGSTYWYGDGVGEYDELKIFNYAKSESEIKQDYEIYLKTSGIQVTLGPAGAITAGAQWNVDGGAWQNSGVAVTGLTAGSRTVNYKPITGWTSPLSEQVAINNNQTVQINRNYAQQTGGLQVTLGPTEAVSAGAQWNVDGGIWRNSGVTVTALTAGSHTVHYKSVAGWNAPASEQVTIIDGQTTSISQSYIQQTGGLQVTLGPSGAITAGAQWNVDGGAWQDSDNTVTGLSVGSHAVNYKLITGWTSPASEQVVINNGQTSQISRNYILQSGSLFVTISPQKAIDAGAQWRRAGTTTWLNSGYTESSVPVGSYTVEFKGIAGWNTPINQSRAINDGQNTSAIGIYTRQAGNLQVKKSTVTAGKGANDNNDSIAFSGTIGVMPADFGGTSEVAVNIGGVYSKTIATSLFVVKSGKYTYTHKIPKGGQGGITSFVIDTNRHTFSLKLQKVDLSGLRCPFNAEIEIGNYWGTSEVEEPIVNGKRFIPVQLMSGVENYLQVQSVKVKKGRLSDTLTIKGGIAYGIMPASMSDVVLNLEGQTFTIPAKNFKPSGKSGLKYVCKNVTIPGGIVNATFDFGKCTFSISIKNAKINSATGKVGLTLTIGSFNEQVNFDLDTGQTIYSSLAGDATGDGIVDLSDLAFFASSWLNTPVVARLDANGDDFIDFTDFAMLANNWQAHD